MQIPVTLVKFPAWLVVWRKLPLKKGCHCVCEGNHHPSLLHPKIPLYLYIRHPNMGTCKRSRQIWIGDSVSKMNPSYSIILHLQRYSQSRQPHSSRPFHDLTGTIPETPISREWSRQLEWHLGVVPTGRTPGQQLCE